MTIDDISTYANSDYVTSYYYTTSISLDGDDIDPATSSSSSNETSHGGGNFGGMGMTMSSSSDFTLVGYSSLDAMTDFIDGSYTIVDGEVDLDDDSNYNCVINEELATLNEIEVGDTITLVNPEDDDKSWKLTVTDIYSITDKEK